MDHQDLNDCGGFMMEAFELFEVWNEYESTEELTEQDAENQKYALEQLNETLDELSSSRISSAMSALEDVKKKVEYEGV